MLAPTTLILGLGRDVGTACARYFQERGHNIVLASPDEAALQRSSEELKENTVTHHGNLHSMMGMRNALNAAFEAYQRVDNLVIIPAVPKPVSLMDVKIEAFDETMIRDARAATLALYLFAKELKEQDPLVSDGPERLRQSGNLNIISFNFYDTACVIVKSTRQRDVKFQCIMNWRRINISMKSSELFYSF